VHAIPYIFIVALQWMQRGIIRVDLITASECHIVRHRTTDVTKTVRKANYSSQNIVAVHCRTLIKNGEFVIMTD